MALNLRSLKAMSEEDLIVEHDKLASNTVIGISYYLDEIRYRESDRLNKKIIHLTKWITVLTIVMAIATVLNVLVFLSDSSTVQSVFK